MERKALFEKGDILLDLPRKRPILILNIVINGEYMSYEYIELKDQHYHTIAGESIYIKKGNTSQRPCDLVEREYSIYKIE